MPWVRRILQAVYVVSLLYQGLDLNIFGISQSIKLGLGNRDLPLHLDWSWIFAPIYSTLLLQYGIKHD